jgi:hypothetical protein
MMRRFARWGDSVATFVQTAWRSAGQTIARPFQSYVLLVIVEGSFPKRLRRKRLYVLTEGGTPWQASMICPCGCGATLEMNLLPDERPRWTFAQDGKRRATLKPSVWRKVGCKSHFVLRNGVVRWV